jgi:hypothetical protein
MRDLYDRGLGFSAVINIGDLPSYVIGLKPMATCGVI